MKKIMFLISALLINTAMADVVIRNKNLSDGYSMQVLYRECHVNNKKITCSDPNPIIIKKGDQFIVPNNATHVIIDKATLINDKTKEIKATSTYLQYPVEALRASSSFCVVTGAATFSAMPIKRQIINLNDMNSPYVVCSYHTKLNLTGVTK